ncbi:uncharacterized protein BDCG_08728 [Blastomyces dermatitidis ER-3]|uniref:Uncharacterized protein n=1 Tax=Ajellomyces dermatitidis (strain ER-3 / ATCC MYA-2586) TaxID=559297 RepID=A0ABP2EPK3_AJEDR|nr:uncharacterized protein BDCG_08728 [Blastomyces dermatitidis ER-3]EEQ85459.2 hypothetical protein BDCG_08728 [Blastomyces dermatitidis ER-3]
MTDSPSQRSYEHWVFLSGAWRLELNVSCGGITEEIQDQILAAATETACQNPEILSDSSNSLWLEFSFARTANMMAFWPAHRKT